MESPALLLLTFSFFAFFFLISHTASVVDPAKNFTREAGGAVRFDTGIPKGASFANVLLRSDSLRKTLAFWVPGKPLNVVSPQYSGRIAFEEESHEFQIRGLTRRDGGVYEVLMETEEEVQRTLRKYTVFVFDISVVAGRAANRSCSLDLLCEAGTGSKQVTYTWKGTETGVTVSQDARLSLLMDPGDRGDSYTCVAKALGTEAAWNVFPYKYCGPLSGAEGLGFETFSLLALLLSISVMLL